MSHEPNILESLKVVIGSQFLDIKTGGAEKYIREVCSRLEGQYHMSLSYLSSDGVHGPGLSGPLIRFFTTGFHPRWQKEMRQALKTIMPHVVYVHQTVPWVSDMLVRAARNFNIPVVMMYHSDVTGPQWTKKTLGILYHLLFGRWTLRICDALLVPSKTFANRSIYLKGMNRTSIVAPPGVEIVLPQKYQTNDRPFILFVGKPELKSKGLWLLTEAWRILRDRFPDLGLVVIGCRKGIEKLPKDDGIQYLGYITCRKELTDWYASAKVTVVPSTAPGESFGMVLAEALLAGCPVVASCLGGIPDLIQEGRNGYLFVPGEIDALAKTIGLALKQEAVLRGHILEDRRFYREQFSWNRTARIVAETLTSVAQAHWQSGQFRNGPRAHTKKIPCRRRPY